MIMLECKRLINSFGMGYIALVPTDEESEEALRKAEGKVLAVKTERARSPQQHRKYFVTLKNVHENQDRFGSAELLRKATLIKIGYCTPSLRFDGSVVLEADSMAFHNLGQEVFQDVFDRSLDVWCEEFGLDPDELLGNAPIGVINA